MGRYNSETSLEELLNLKEELKNEMQELDMEIEHKKKLNKPYRYTVSAHSRVSDGGEDSYKKVRGKLVERSYKSRIGTGLIYYGYTYLYNKDKSKELLDLFINTLNGYGLPGSLKLLTKVLSKDKRLNGYKYEKALVELISEFIEGDKDLANITFKPNIKLINDFKKLGKSLDDNLKEDGTNKLEIIRDTELENYSIIVSEERIKVFKKGEI